MYNSWVTHSTTGQVRSYSMVVTGQTCIEAENFGALKLIVTELIDTNMPSTIFSASPYLPDALLVKQKYQTIK